MERNRLRIVRGGFDKTQGAETDSCTMKYRKYGIVELLDNKLDGVYVSAGTI